MSFFYYICLTKIYSQIIIIKNNSSIINTGVTGMKQRMLIVTAFFLLVSVSAGFGDVRLDDFENFFANNPEQCWLGEAYGYSITKTWGSVDTGNGWWSPYMDEKGTQITNGKQEPVDSSNAGTLVENGEMHLYFKTHLSSCTQTGDDYAYAGIYCDLMKDSLTYFDFTDMTAISLKLKGRGNIRVLFQTKDIYEMTDSNGVLVGWGYYGFDVKMDSTFDEWQTKLIPADMLETEMWSPAWEKGWKWHPDSAQLATNPDGGCQRVKGFAIQAIPDEDTATNDSVHLYVDDIYLLGLDYKKTFGFDIDTNVGIIYIPENKSQNNIAITSSHHNKAISVSYTLEQSSDVYIAVYDMKGKIISELVNGRQGKGKKQILADFNNRAVTSGVYFITIRINGATVTRKFNYLK